jgi:CBS domain containing-hemolysin-like protein
VVLILSRSEKLQARATAALQQSPQIGEDEFLLMLEEGHKEGTVQETELKLIQNVFSMDDTTISEIMSPLTQVFSLPAQTTVRDAALQVQRRGSLRVPVLGKTKTEITGILYAKDLLGAGSESGPIDPLVRQAFFCPRHDDSQPPVPVPEKQQDPHCDRDGRHRQASGRRHHGPGPRGTFRGPLPEGRP